MPVGDRLGMVKYISEHYGYVPKVTKQTDTFSKTLLRCVENGMGITIGTDFCIYTGAYKLAALSFGLEPVHKTFALVYHKNHYIDMASQYLIELCREAAAFHIF